MTSVRERRCYLFRPMRRGYHECSKARAKPALHSLISRLSTSILISPETTVLCPLIRRAQSRTKTQ